MASDLRIDSSDFRTELLSPIPDGENIAASMEPSWRLSMDKFQLPKNRVDSGFGFGQFVSTLSKSCIYLILNLICSVVLILNWVLVFSGKQRKIVKYYKKQEELLKGYNEVDIFTELGNLPGRLSEVCSAESYQLL